MEPSSQTPVTAASDRCGFTRATAPGRTPPCSAPRAVFEIHGQIHLGQPGQLVLPALPDNLVSKPTLVWLLRNQAATVQRVEASYLTRGTADTRSDLTGWVTIDNKSRTTYGSAALKLVAGDVNRAEEPRRAAARAGGGGLRITQG